MKRTVAIGFIGATLDRLGKGAARWQKWRPSIGLCQQPDLLIDRLELIHGNDARDLGLAERIRADIAAVSPHTEVRLQQMELRNPWDFEEVYGALHDFVSAYPFDTEREDYLVHITTGTHVAQICWFLLTEARYLPARLVQTSPSRRKDEARHPEGSATLIDLDLSRYDRIASRFRREQEESLAFLKSGIATRNAAFNRSIEQIERVAVRSRAPMLLVGPTGAGKSFLARRIYELKRSRHQLDGRFVEVNCATLRGDGAMSALFGHVKGAFTGAQNAREGLLRAADGGMLFLDEIGELGADEQAMLLKAIEEKRFFPLGSDREVESDFQLIAGTHRDLRGRVAEGLFREDLFARINLWTFELPGLAGRREDIEPNIDFELERHAREQGRQVRFNLEAKRRYLAFAGSSEARWAGNFRELSASITRMATLADSGRIDEALVEEEILRLRQAWGLDAGREPLADLLGQRVEALDLFVCNCRRCWRCAAGLRPFPRRDAGCSPFRARTSATPTTPTGCASTWRVSAWTGRRYAPEHHFGISLASFHGLQGRMPMSEIMDVERLRQRCAAGESFKYLYFWGHRPATDDKVGKSCFSQWYEASFKLDGVRYASAEHYMMAAKARLFDDPRLLERILAARSPGEAKVLGREVAGFDEARWNAERVGIVIEGNLGKFGQNASLKKYLLGTADRVLVEASPVDAIWGIGLAASDPLAAEPATWQGLNLLGFALMEVRRRLAQ